MNTKGYVKSLFKDYEETDELRDFMEELRTNLDDRIASMVRKGMGEAEAFEKASGELGDISALADEISLQKRREVFEERYMDVRRYMKAPRVAAYVLFGLSFLFGILLALIVYFAVNNGGGLSPELLGPDGARYDLPGVFAMLMTFVTAAIGGYTWLGLTQETASRYPMKKKRALLYALGAFLIVFAVFLFPMVYFAAGTRDGMAGAISSLLPFVLTGSALLAFLILTEKERRKPWALVHYAEELKKSRKLWQDPAAAARFGLFSGAIWIFAFGLFFLLGFTAGFKFSWMTFVFALAVQLLVQALLCKRPAGSEKN
jgi:hypothetical protein